MNILFTTRTNWAEPKRIRHQLAELLLEKGHNVIFVEKPAPVWKKVSPIRIPLDGLMLVSINGLIHPQLRVFNFLDRLDQRYRKGQLKSILKEYQIDLHIAFYIDSSSIFPSVNTIQVINDDFVMKTKWFSRLVAKRTFRDSIKRAKKVLVVSYPLRDKVKRISNNAELFFPWYEELRFSQFEGRRKILYLGYLAGRVRWDVLEYLLKKDIEIDMYAPPSSATKQDLKHLNSLGRYHNFSFHGEGKIEELDLNNYVCSIQPYDRAIPNTDMISFSNRTVRLLALGLPSLHEHLPYLIKSKESVIYKAHTPREYFDGYKFLAENSDRVKKDIYEFLQVHSKLYRQKQIDEIIDEITRF